MSTMRPVVIRIDTVVQWLEVWLDDTFPFAKMKVKVIDRGQSDYLAVTNLLFRDANGETDSEAGMGSTPKEAIEDLLSRFITNSNERRPNNGFQASDFEWASHEDF